MPVARSGASCVITLFSKNSIETSVETMSEKIKEGFFKKTGCCGLSIAQILFGGNVIGALVHLIFAITTLIVAANEHKDNDVTKPTFTTYITKVSFNQSNVDDPFRPSIEKFGSFSIPFATFGFFMLSFIAHSAIVILNYKQLLAKNHIDAENKYTESYLAGWYLPWITDARAPFRWVEYFFSAPLMILLIAVVAGIQNIMTLVLLWGLIATTIIFGNICEEMNEVNLFEGKRRWSRDIVKDLEGPKYSNNWFARLWPTLLGWIPFLFAIVIILWNFQNSIDVARDAGREVPGYVYLVVVGQTILFASFSFPQIGVLANPDPDKYWRGEITYVILSLTSKAFLGITFMGAIFGFNSLEENLINT